MFDYCDQFDDIYYIALAVFRQTQIQMDLFEKHMPTLPVGHKQQLVNMMTRINIAVQKTAEE
ncbi:17959_t:CDS:2, partial [Acaulospora morrowiae]